MLSYNFINFILNLQNIDHILVNIRQLELAELSPLWTVCSTKQIFFMEKNNDFLKL